MSLFIFLLALVAMAAVAVVLGGGLYTLFRGGEVSRTWSNKLMRLRILFQAIAIVLLVLFVWIAQSGR